MAFMLKLQALSDLFARYRAVFVHAWTNRVAMEGPGYQRFEADFLPAALSLQETPVSPAPRIAMWLLIVFAMLGLAWAVFGKIDIVATAQGKFIPNDRSKTVQPLERSVVQAIHVRDGQAVKAGDLLVELDATTLQADRDRVAHDLALAALQVQRAQDMLAALDEGHAPEAKRPQNVPDPLWLESLRLLEGQYVEYQSKLTRLAADIAQKRAELHSTQELVRKLEQTAPLARRRAEDYKGLVDQNFVSRHGYLEKEQVRIEQEADLANQRSRLQEIQAALEAAHAQKAAMRSETRRQQLDSANEGAQKLATLEQELLKADSRARQTKLLAPVDGTVQQLAIHTVGGVVTEAQPLMVIVPRGDELEIEAFLENKDIGFVSPGQGAEVKVEAFPYTKYGTVPAAVASVSSDAISDEKRGLIYATRVRVSRTTIGVEGKQVLLSPGMAVSVEIKTGRRRVIEYFLSPLVQVGSESLRER